MNVLKYISRILCVYISVGSTIKLIAYLWIRLQNLKPSHFIRIKLISQCKYRLCYDFHFSFYFFPAHPGDYERAFGASVTINESSFVCKESFTDTRTFAGRNPTTAHGIDTNDTGDELPTIYFITPTYPRREQFAELVRLGQTLMHVPNLHWIVADDTDSCNPQIDEFLNRFGKILLFGWIVVRFALCLCVLFNLCKFQYRSMCERGEHKKNVQNRSEGHHI